MNIAGMAFAALTATAGIAHASAEFPEQWTKPHNGRLLIELMTKPGQTRGEVTRLKRLGAHVSGIAPASIEARVPAEALSAIEADPAVRYVRAADPGVPEVVTARRWCGPRRVPRRPPESPAPGSR